MAQTRAEMAETINALQERLEPERLKRQAAETFRETTDDLKHKAAESVREATIGKAEQFMNNVEYTARETSSGLLDTIRQNPIPAALIGTGLAWLLFGGSDRRSNGFAYGRDRNNAWSRGPQVYHGMRAPDPGHGTMYGPSNHYGDRYDDSNVGGQPGHVVQNLGQQAQDLSSQAKDRVASVGSQVQDTVQDFGNRAQSTVQNLGTRAQDQFESTRDDLRDQFQQASTNVDQLFDRSPLAVGVIAIALGATIGLAMPPTEPEARLMGDAREQFMQKASDAAKDTLDKVQRVADKVSTAASDAVKEEAPTSGS
jgi:ElaB/YqjD/DUF883 family membrane-anchored ribosome-binding protein